MHHLYGLPRRIRSCQNLGVDESGVLPNDDMHGGESVPPIEVNSRVSRESSSMLKLITKYVLTIICNARLITARKTLKTLQSPLQPNPVSNEINQEHTSAIFDERIILQFQAL